MKYLWTIIMASSVLFASSIVGSWKVDKERSLRENKNIDPAGFEMFKYIDIDKNHAVNIKPIGFEGKVQQGTKGYFMMLMGKKIPITPVDANYLKLKFEDNVYYKRLGNAIKDFKQSDVTFKLGEIYRTKIKDEYAFILLSKNRTMYFMQTDVKNKISPKEIKAGKIKIRKNSSYFSDNTSYELKNGNPYLAVEGQEIKVISSEKFEYRGNVYVLQK